jgi:hypothetical protein
VLAPRTRGPVALLAPGTAAVREHGARGDAPAPGRWDDARTLSTRTADEHPDVLTVPAHERMP